jgi:foldase protein PrsA
MSSRSGQGDEPAISSQRPMRRPWVKVPAVVALLALALTLAACGGSSSNGGADGSAGAGPNSAAGAPEGLAAPISPKVKAAATAKAAHLPAPVIATIAGAPVTKTQFDRVFAQATRGLNGQGAIPLDPPAYTRCAAALRDQQAQLRQRFAKLIAHLPKAQRHGKTPTLPANHASLQAQCRQRQAAVMQSTMAQLIQARWTEQQAKAAGITVTDADITRAIAQQRASYHSAKLWSRFLERSGQTATSMRARVRLQLLGQKLQAKRTANAPKVSDVQVQAYFKAHEAQFGLPTRRDLQVILAKTSAQAAAAKAAIAHGMSWEAATAKYSIDPASKTTGGAMPAVVLGSREPALDTLAFHARQGQLAGPAKGQRGYWLVRVTKIYPAVKPAIGPYRQRIRQLLQQQTLGKRVSAATAREQSRLRAATVCRPHYAISLCANAPKAGRAR